MKHILFLIVLNHFPYGTLCPSAGNSPSLVVSLAKHEPESTTSHAPSTRQPRVQSECYFCSIFELYGYRKAILEMSFLELGFVRNITGLASFRSVLVK